MRPTMRKESIPTEPIDILTPENVREYGSLSSIFGRCPHPSLSDGFTIFEPSLVEVFREVMERLRDDPFGFLLIRMLVEPDDICPGIRVFESGFERFWHESE
jgi:hypothetical protein